MLRTWSFYSPRRQVVFLSSYFTDGKTVLQLFLVPVGELANCLSESRSRCSILQPEGLMFLSLLALAVPSTHPKYLIIYAYKVTPCCTDYHTNISVREYLFSVFESLTLTAVLIFTLAACANIRKHWHGYWKWAIRPPSRTMLLTQMCQTLKFAVTSFLYNSS